MRCQLNSDPDSPDGFFARVLKTGVHILSRLKRGMFGTQGDRRPYFGRLAPVPEKCVLYIGIRDYTMSKTRNVRYDPAVAKRGTTFCMRRTRTVVPGSKSSV